MNSRTLATCAFVASSTVALPAPAYAGCEAESGPNTTALIELYTSEGCSSCPPADRQLSELRSALGAQASLIPLAMHVDYWDYIGWKDRYAQRSFSDRQKWLVRANSMRTIYTPQFFVSGSEVRSKRSTIPTEVRRLNVTPAAASIRIRGEPVGTAALAISAEAKARDGGGLHALYLAITESGLVSNVTRGENSGGTLKHDHVVRKWIGPIRFVGSGAKAHNEIALPREWNRKALEIVAFVQNERTGAVVQAVSARNCANS